jgi:hypothetical protein
MENLRGVEAVMIDTVDGDRIVYDVQVQGGPERLQQALELSNLVVLVDESGGDPGAANRNESSGRRDNALEFQYRMD